MLSIGRLSRRQLNHCLAELSAAGRSWQCAAAVSPDAACCAGTAPASAALAGDGPPGAAPMLLLQPGCSQIIGLASGGGEQRAVCQLLPHIGVPSVWPHWSTPTMAAQARSYSSKTTASITAPDHGSKAQHTRGGSSHAGTDSEARSTAQAGAEAETEKAGQQSVAPEPILNQGSKESGSLAKAGWSRQEIWNAPNAISVARLVSGPIIAGWIIAGDWQTALIALAISGTESRQATHAGDACLSLFSIQLLDAAQ